MAKQSMYTTSLKMLSASCVLLTASLLGACTVSETTTLTGNGGVPIDSEVQPADNNRRYEVRFQLAMAYYEDGGSADIAMEEVEKALELRPNAPEAIALKGMIYSQMGDTAKALGYLKRAADLDSTGGVYMYNYGAVLCQQKMYEEGAKVLQTAIGMNTTNIDRLRSWTALGACYRDAGDGQRAEAAYRQVLSLDPRNTVALYHIAEMMFNRNDMEGAKYYFDQLGSINKLRAPALWLGVKMARTQNDGYMMSQYARVLCDKYPTSKECAALKVGSYN